LRFEVRVWLSIWCGLVALVVAPGAHGARLRDDTAWLQARLDAGGTVDLPKLPGGRCYAARGLWISHDDTRITSDGGCIVALGPGASRIKTAAGRPVRATALFYLNHSDIYKPLPVRIAISGIRIIVPGAAHVAGVIVNGNEVTIDDVTVSGSPTADVVVGGGKPGSGGITERVEISNSSLAGGRRDVVSATGVIGLRIDHSTITGARRIPRGRAGAGIQVAAADRGQPTLDVHLVDDTIADNTGPGILLDLAPKNGSPVVASDIEISGNRVLRNARQAAPSRRGGIVLVGGQDDGAGQLTLANNVVHANRGPGVLRRALLLASEMHGNDLRGNSGGTITGSTASTGRVEGGKTWRPNAGSGAGGDDTAWLQARLDAAGGTIFLPKLPDGECYETRGLWVSHDNTTITSDGACIVSLGPGPVRLRSTDGDAIAAEAVFFVNRSHATGPAPVHITISNLKITVPTGQPSMYGVAVFGHQVTLSGLDIGGTPKDDVLIGGRANGNGYADSVSVLHSTLSGAGRNAISAFGVIGLTIDGNLVHDVRDVPPGQPAAGIDVEPDDRGQPTLDVHIVHNTIADNAGPGILLELDTNSGPAAIASDLEVSANTIVRNAHRRIPPKRAGVILAGGQDLVPGSLVFRDNVVDDNGGPGVLALRLGLLVEAAGNELRDNDAGPTQGITLNQ
jgi:hypothetical protein